MKSVETRIGELKFSARSRYGEDFERVRSEIMRASDPDLAKDSGLGFDMRKDAAPRGRMHFFAASDGRILLPSEMKEMLKDGNINRRSVRIHPEHSWFALRYDLRLYFDPTKSHPRGFDPFKDPFPVRDSRMTVSLDLPVTEILEGIRKARSPTKTRSKKSDHFPEEKIHDVNLLLQKKLTPLKIFWKTNPDYLGWNPRQDYIKNDHRTGRDYLANDRWQAVARLIRKLKKLPRRRKLDKSSR